MSTSTTLTPLDTRFTEARGLERASRFDEAHKIYLLLAAEKHWRSLYRISRILLGIEPQWEEICFIKPDREASLRYLDRAYEANRESHAIKVEYLQRRNKTSIEHQVLRRTHEKFYAEFKSGFRLEITTEEEKARMLNKYLTHPEIFTKEEEKWMLKNCAKKKAEASPALSTPLLEDYQREKSEIEMSSRRSPSYTPPGI